MQRLLKLVDESNEEVLTLSPFSNKVVYDEEREDGLSTSGNYHKSTAGGPRYQCFHTNR
jgi:hypothetical protein